MSSSFPGTYVTTAEATDADDPETDNAALRYSILEQGSPQLFSIDEHTGEIRTVHVGLDREVRPPPLHLESWGQGSQCHIWLILAHLLDEQEQLISRWALCPSPAYLDPASPTVEGAPSCCRHSWWLWAET